MEEQCRILIPRNEVSQRRTLYESADKPSGKYLPRVSRAVQPAPVPSPSRRRALPLLISSRSDSEHSSSSTISLNL